MLDKNNFYSLHTTQCPHRNTDNLRKAISIGYSLVALVMADDHLIVVTSSVADCVDDSVLTLSRAHREAHEEDRGPTDPTAGGRGPTRAGERLSLPRTHQVYASRAAHRRCLVSVTARKCLRNEMSCWGLWFYFAVISLPKCVRST